MSKQTPAHSPDAQHALDASLQYHAARGDNASPARIAQTARKFYEVLQHPERAPRASQSSEDKTAESAESAEDS